MSTGIIQVLPDHIANQIAAGEVIQRPASAVKELLENSIDAGATSIHLLLKEAGKNLIQIIDDGCGMSSTDAAACFVRHATSKISKTEDIFNIKTKGFRGEAMASIASVAQVELNTKRIEDELGAKVFIEGSVLKEQGEVSCNNGSNVKIKNLFFNIPARRKFLKSNAVELKHCIDQFQRVALIHPEVEMKFSHNNEVVFELKKSNLKQRVIQVLGKQYANHLIPVETETEVVQIKGFVFNPKSAKKTRGDQYLFVNNRYIKSGYLHHAIAGTFEEYLQEKQHPGYLLSLQVNPSKIDVNIHPTKTEIKFEDEKVIYAILKSCVQKGIAQYGVSPSLDFTVEQSFNVPFFDPKKPIKEPTIVTDKNFNPFDKEKKDSKGSAASVSSSPSFSHQPKQSGSQDWQKMYQGFENDNTNSDALEEQTSLYAGASPSSEEVQISRAFQVYNTYLICLFNQQLIMVHQARAHERILYDKFQKRFLEESRVVQQLLFPEQLEFSAAKYALLVASLEELTRFGFEVEPFGKNTLVFRGIPTDMSGEEIAPFVDELLSILEENLPAEKRRIKILKSMALKARTRAGKVLQTEEVEYLLQELFHCENSLLSPRKETIYTILNQEKLAQLL